MNVSDYLIDQESKDWASLLSGWSQLLPASFTVWLVNRFGDVFAVYEDGSVNLLDVANGTIQRVANNRDDLCDRIDLDSNALDWLMPPLVDQCVTAGLTLSNSECYGFKTPPLLGGEYAVENVYVADLRAYYSFLSDLFQQTKDLPDGSRVKIVITNSPIDSERGR